MNPHPLRDRHARLFGAVLLSLFVATSVSARQLPNVDALADAPAVPLAKTLREDGWLKAFKGMTSVEEVMRVTEDAG